MSNRLPYAAGLTDNLPDLQLEETFPDPPRTGERVQRWYCAGCEEWHEGSVLGVEWAEAPLKSLAEVESERQAVSEG